jgi:hypothetical protein
MRWLVGLSAFFVVEAVAYAEPKRAAEDVDACVAAVDRGQAARRKGTLREARASFIECARDACPTPIRADCTHWLEDIDARLPRISIRAVSSAGADLDATLTVDGTREADRSLSLDPGPHVLHAEASGFLPLEQRIVLVEGERRVVTMTLDPVARAPAPVLPPPPPVETPERRGPSALTLGVAGLGVVALGTFGTFALIGRSRASDLENGCGKTSTCDPADVDAAKSKYLVADISLGVGIAALAAAAILWLTVDARGSVGHPARQ